MYVSPQDDIRQYVVRKDFFSTKSGEFSISDTIEKQLHYRIESNYGLFQNLKVVAYPSKQEVGRLQAKFKLVLYKAEISILDPQTNKWVNGIIEQKFQVLGRLFNIDWNGNLITMELKVTSFGTQFHDANGQLLAQFTMRISSAIWTNKYDMQIYSNKYPEQIYLLALAVQDYIVSTRTKT